jgi:uncharacterized membrane protein YphA (DoxX/SURF4 family)
VKPMIFRLLHWACRVGLAGVFLHTGYIKWESPLQFAAILSGYRLFPDWLIVPLMNYFPYVEMGLGVLLLIGVKIRYVATAATGLLASFIAVLTITYMRGIEANCGCFSFDDLITPLTILRDGVIILPAIYLMVEPRVRAYFGGRAQTAGEAAAPANGWGAARNE